MTSHDILDMIGDAKGKYLLEAQRHRESQPQPRRLSLKRVWLMAAVIVLALLLVGCAIVYILSLQDMAFGTRTQEYYDGSSQEVTLLSIQGIKGSPGYQATKEWYEWLETYDTDMAIYHSEEAFSEDFGDDYYAYNLYSREMKDKLDEICAKYGLELLGKMYVDPDIEAGCKALQIQSVFRPGVQVEESFDSIHYYANGSFDLEGYMSLDGEQRHIVSYRCHRKNAFSDLYASVGPEGTYEEWIYTTSYGVDVLMVLDYGGVRGNAKMYVEQGEYVFVFSIHEFDDMPLPDKEMLEAYAEVFDFTVRPRRVSQQEIEKTEERQEEANAAFAEEYDKMAHSFSSLGYENRIKFQLEYAVNPEQLGFAILDLEGNGSEDLLVGENGYIRAVYTTKDGGSQHMMPMSIVHTDVYTTGADKGVGEFQGASWSYLYLCENNSLAYVYDREGDSVAYHFASVVNGELVWTDRILYDPQNPYLEDSKWQRFDENHHSHPITEEEFNSIVASYPRVVLDMYPISDYPLMDDSPSGIGNPPDVYESFDHLVASRIEYTEDMAQERRDWEYQLTDLDGDGQQELIWKEGSWKGVFTMQNGQVKQLASGVDLAITDKNAVIVERHYLDGNSAWCCYKIENGEAILLDYLRYDAHRDPANPWFRSADASGQDVSLFPISEAEYNRLKGSHTPMELDWKPVTQYPLS